MDDWQCVSEYVREGSQSAFAEVVNRHVDLVYATCRRVVRDAHLAEDATQAVFVILAKKARTIRRNTSLVGWLHNTARYVACNALRVAANRRRHEMEAAQMPRTKRSGEDTSNSAAEDVVDRALNRLEAQERDAILLRFFEGRRFREVGAALSISEEAAKKRVWRGIEKLRQMLTPAGSAAPAAATIAGILATASHPAPAALASAAVATALTGTGAAISLAKGAVIAMAISKTKATAAAAIVMILLMGGAVVVVKDMVNRPKPIAYSIPASKPATQPAMDVPQQALAEWVLDTVPVVDNKPRGEPLIVAAAACTHLEKNPQAAATTCIACHTAAKNPVARVNLNTGTLNIAADNGMIHLARNLQGILVFDNANLVAGNVLIQLVDNNGLAVGTDAPAIDVKQADGTKLTLADLKGKFVLLHFWDSASKESAEQMPHLRAAKKEWGNEPRLVIVGINVDEKAKAAAAFAKEQKMEWMQGFAGAGSKLMQDYHLGVGTAVLIGPDGKIVNGSLSGLGIDDALDKALRPQ